MVGADAVYVKSWGSVKLFGNPREEAALRAGFATGGSPRTGSARPAAARGS